MSLDPFVGPKLSPKAEDFYSNRPGNADCNLCRGMGYFPELELCPDCAGVGLEAIPWTELFAGTTHRGVWLRT